MSQLITRYNAPRRRQGSKSTRSELNQNSRVKQIERAQAVKRPQQTRREIYNSAYWCHTWRQPWRHTSLFNPVFYPTLFFIAHSYMRQREQLATGIVLFLYESRITCEHHIIFVFISSGLSKICGDGSVNCIGFIIGATHRTKYNFLPTILGKVYEVNYLLWSRNTSTYTMHADINSLGCSYNVQLPVLHD